jgi:hypothetical protein
MFKDRDFKEEFWQENLKKLIRFKAELLTG